MEKSKFTNIIVTTARIIIGQKGILLFFVSFDRKPGHRLSSASIRKSLEPLAIIEFVAYLNFSPYLQTAGTLDAKTVAIISFALCGFANFGSIGVVVGAFSAVAPHRAPEIAQLGLRALAAATLSNLMSATIAGFFIGLA